MIFLRVFPPCALELRHGNSFGHVEEMAQTSIGVEVEDLVWAMNPSSAYKAMEICNCCSR